MRLIKLELKNYCQHADVTVEFAGNLNGIVGANGSGKSNLLGAIYFALTNDNPNTGKKQENIRSGTQESEQSLVRLHFEHNGASGVVTRYLRTGVKSKLTLSGHNPIEGDTPVTNLIMDMLGVDVPTLRQLVIVSQDSLYGVLSETPAVRAKLYQRLFQVDRAEKIHTLLRDEVLKHQPGEADDLIDYTEQLQQAETSLSELATDLASFYAVAEETAARDLLIATLAKLKSEQQQLQKVLQARQLLLTEEQALNTLQQLAADWQVRVNEASADDEKYRVAWLEMKQLRDQYNKSQEQRAKRDKLQQEIVTKEAEIAAIVIPDINELFYAGTEQLSPSNLSEFKARLSELRHDLASLRQLSASLNDAANGTCPLCKTPAEQLQARLAGLRDEIATKAAEETQLAYSVQQYDEHLQAIELAATRVMTLSQTLDNLRNSFSVLSSVVDVEFSEEKYAELTAAGCEVNLNLSRFKAALFDAENNAKQKAINNSGLRAISNSMPDDATDEAYVKAIADCEGRLKDCTTYLETAATIKELHQQAKLEYNTIKAAADNAAAVRRTRTQKRAVHEHFKQLAAIYHHDAAPRDLTQQNLELCQTRLNTILAEFGAKFSTTVREDLSFDCIFPDKVQPAHRLSCGQRVVLALCLRIALVTTLLPEVGLLLLDEPTTFLDADTIKSFNSALEKLREFAVAANIQVVIVTHCTDLIPAFDGVIQL